MTKESNYDNAQSRLFMAQTRSMAMTPQEPTWTEMPTVDGMLGLDVCLACGQMAGYSHHPLCHVSLNFRAEKAEAELASVKERLKLATEVVNATREAIDDFEALKKRQHELLGHGLKEACENWDEATLVYFEFQDMIDKVCAFDAAQENPK